MVVSHGPAKFYGSSLPRPRFYTEVKFNDHRVDPPVPVTDALMSWAHKAHWSMGGLEEKRLRLQGKIEGNVDKLRTQRDKVSKAQAHSPLSISRPDLSGSKRKASLSPPPAPIAAKLRKPVALIADEDEELVEEIEEEEEAKVRFIRRGVPRRLVKKLGDDFDRVASTESNGVDSDSMGLRTRSRRLIKGGGGADAVKKVVEEEGEKSNSKRNKNKSEAEKSPVSSTNGVRVRTSPRLAKRGFN